MNKLTMDFYYGFTPFILCYDPTPEEAAAATKAAEATAAAAKAAEESKGKSFSQEQVNTILATDRRKSDDRNKQTLDELEALRAKSSLTASERSELDTTIENLQSSLMTEKELTAKQTAKTTKQHKQEITDIQKSRDQWQNLYTDSTIERAIVDAAGSGPNKAFNASQVVAILRPDTRLVEELNSDGEKTGKMVPMVKFADVGKDGKPVTLDLAVSAAVKRMRELDQFLNLFEGDGPGGMGKTTKGSGKSGDTDIAKLAAGDPATYRAARKAGTIKIQ
ncbi:MAG: hypothetical protein QQN63_01650 [Nitrosopumilus sp.]